LKIKTLLRVNRPKALTTGSKRLNGVAPSPNDYTVPGSLDKKKRKKMAPFALIKDATFFPSFFLSNDPGTG
jgi:hypothetical protein